MNNNYTIIDVCHTVYDGMVTYKGLPGPTITDFLDREQSRAHYAPGTEFHIGRIDMVANTGTYLDTPFHRYAGRKDLADLDLYSVANLEGIVVRVTDALTRAIEPATLGGLEVKGKAVIFHTGWDRYWRSEPYANGLHPFLTAATAHYLADHGAALVGIDSYNIDDTADLSRPAHSILLDHDIPIVEHLCGLNDVPDHDFRFFAVPVKVKGMGTFPVRAFAIAAAVHS